MPATVQIDDASYVIQESIEGYVIAELDVIGGAKAIMTAKRWDRDPCKQGDSIRVICDGELVWPNPLRCDACGAYLKSEGATCPVALADTH